MTGWRAIEWFVLFVGLPVAVWVGLIPIHIIALLLLVMAVCASLLLADPAFDRGQLGNWPGLKPQVRRVVLTFFVCAVALTAVVAWATPERLFAFPRRRPVLFSAIMVLYPLLSVWPQELVYRAFFFHRYRRLFPGPRSMALASAAAFGFMHIVFGNPIAVGLSFLGGLLFARTYAASRSLLASSLEHTLYGWLIFTIGLGQFFYLGSSERTIFPLVRRWLGWG